MNFLSLDELFGRRILLLSPHADDIAYSVGGLVSLLFSRADLFLTTIFGRSGWVLPHASYGRSINAVSLEREREDREYCTRQYISYEQLYCLDSNVMGYSDTMELCITTSEDSRTDGAVTLIRDAVARCAPEVLLAPCGLGGHIDHQIVRLAVDGVDNVEVFYYEDIPYCSSLPLSTIEMQLGYQGLTPAGIFDIKMVLESKCEGMWIYRTQTDIYTIAQMLSHAARLGANIGKGEYAERLWCRKI